jgi:hypothetical protein
VLRASRSSRVTISTSPASRRLITLANSGLSFPTPLIFSEYTFTQPAALSCASCETRLWPSVLTLA